MNSTTQNRTIEWVLLLAIILFFFPYLSLGVSTNDDAFNQVYNSWSDFKGNAFKQGRIQFLLFHWLIIKISYLVQNFLFIKFISIAAILGNIFYVGFFIEKITQQKYYRFLFIIVFVTFLQDSWDHFLLTSSPLIYTVAFSMFLGSLHLHSFCEKTRKNALISAGLLALTLQISEMFFLFFIFYALFSKLLFKKPIFYNLKYHFIFAGIYLVFYVGFRLMYSSIYVGNSVDSQGFSILNAIQTLLAYSLYTFPSALFFSHTATGLSDINNVLSYPFDFNLSINPLSKFIKNVKILIFNFDEMNVLWIIKYLLFSWVAFESLKKIKVLTKKTTIFLIIFGVLLLFVPNALHSLVGKYQQWAIVGNSKGYVGTYMSYFGMVILLTLFLVYLKQLQWFDRPTYLSKIGLGVVILFLFFISTFVSISNEAVFNLKKQSHYRWELMHKLFKTDEFLALNKGSKIYTQGLMTPIGAVDRYKPLPNQRSDYWDRYVLMKTGQHIQVLEGALPQTPSKNDYVLKLIKPKNTIDAFGVFASLQNNSGLINDFLLVAVARDTNILTYESLAGFKSFPFRLKGIKDTLLITETGVSLNSLSVQQEIRGRDSHLVYAKPMQKGKIYTDRFEYNFGTGFYLEEASGAHKWHWSDKKSELIIENKAKENIVVHLRFTFSSKQEINTKIAIYKDINTQHIITVNKGDQETVVSFQLQVGKNTIHFVSEESAQPLPSVSARPLYFYVKNLIMTEVR